MKKLIVFSLCILLMINQAGCNVLTEKEKSLFGTIAIVTPPNDKTVHLDIPYRTTWEGVKKGSALGAEIVFPHLDNPMAVLFSPFFIFSYGVIGSVIGGIAGVLRSENKVAKINKAETILNRAIERTDFQELMRDCVHKTILEHTPYKPVVIDDINTILDGNNDYRDLEGIDTVLEINFNVELDYAFIMNASAKFIRAQNNGLIYQIPRDSYLLRYKKERESFVRWSDNDAQIFLREFDSACEAVSSKLIKIIT